MPVSRGKIGEVDTEKRDYRYLSLVKIRESSRWRGSGRRTRDARGTIDTPALPAYTRPHAPFRACRPSAPPLCEGAQP